MYDVVIIGAGVIGAMTARLLSRYDVKICIAESQNDIAMGSTKANSAIVHAGFDAKNGSLKAKLNVRGSEMMREICEDLGVDYINNGSLVIGFSKEDITGLEALKENGEKNGVKGLEILEREDLKRLEPNISDDAVCALYAPTGAIICPYELCEASIGNAMDNGAELKLNYEVSNIKKTKFGYDIISSKGETIHTKTVINAAGIHSDKIAKMIGDNSFEIHPRKGEYMLLDKECGKTVTHTIFTLPTNMGKGILVTQTVDGNLLLGPTSVDGLDKTDKKTTNVGIDIISKNAGKMVDGIDFKMVITSFCGLRSVGNTGDFIINTPRPGFINVAGIESPGLSASPAIAEYVLDLLKNSDISLTEKPHYIKKRISLKHFKDWDIDKKNELIRKDPAFGNIVCRCEGISEGEIRHAIRTNPKPHDLDGVKRRTRAQMGRCQGGFCSPYIISLLAEELGENIENITKSGGHSYVVASKTKEDGNNA